MRRHLLVAALAGLTLLAVGLVVLPKGAEAVGTAAIDEQVHANLVRVKIHGNWEEFPMIPLADHLCRNPDALFRRYCDEDAHPAKSTW